METFSFIRLPLFLFKTRLHISFEQWKVACNSGDQLGHYEWQLSKNLEVL